MTEHVYVQVDDQIGHQSPLQTDQVTLAAIGYVAVRLTETPISIDKFADAVEEERSLILPRSRC